MDKAEERVYRLALHYYVHDKNIYTDNFSRKTQYKYQEIMAEVEWKNRSIFYCCCWKEFTTATATITSKKLQNTTLHVHHALLYISFPSLQDYNLKMPNFRFNEERKQTKTNLSFSFFPWVSLTHSLILFWSRLGHKAQG